MRFNCVGAVVDRKHIRLDHFQRLAFVQFMVSKDFLDDEIHDFFKTVYSSEGRRDYDFGITQARLSVLGVFMSEGVDRIPALLR